MSERRSSIMKTKHQLFIHATISSIKIKGFIVYLNLLYPFDADLEYIYDVLLLYSTYAQCMLKVRMIQLILTQ